LKDRDRVRQIPQPARPQIHQINAAEQTRCRRGQQHLPAVARGHHSRGPVQHRTEVVTVAQLSAFMAITNTGSDGNN
jgi:hypothetical protein